jgi:2-polyprenyl-3-methyl-5-hydroxy-6-metoxy-1,4-benzoquinol methylase
MISVPFCPACGGQVFTTRVKLNHHTYEKFILFSKLKYAGLLDSWLTDLAPEIVECDYCCHHWYRRQPSAHQLSQMYACGIPLQSTVVARKPTSAMLAEMTRLYRASGSNTPTLLDFGSGYGRWARAASRVGFRVFAFEPSEERGSERASEFTLVHQLSAIEGEIFDVVNLEQVLEHVPDPLTVLKTIKEYCHSNAIIRIRVPNIDKPPEGPDLWEKWPYSGVPAHQVHSMAPFEHLHGFTPKSLRTLALRAGFRVGTKWRIARSYPLAWMRQMFGAFRPEWGSTFLLLELNHESIQCAQHPG